MSGSATRPGSQAAGVKVPPEQVFTKRHHWGYVAVVVSVLVTYALWIGSKWYYDDWYDERLKYVAKIGSMGATMLFCWSFILVTRFRILDRLLGGLDKGYQIHRRIGEISFYLILLHPTFLALPHLPDWSAFLGFFWFSDDWIRNTGIIALLGFLLLLALTLWINIARHVWKITHSFFGLLLLVVIVHLVTADAEIMTYPALKAWFAIWITTALCCFAYVRFLYHSFGPLHLFQVADVREIGDVVEVELASLQRRRFRHQPGQFLWIDFLTPELRQESHPFTISSPPQSARTRISVKKLGDWTADLPKLTPGTRARVWGPYGVFARGFLRHRDRTSVLVAGGVGITPFISMVEDEAFAQRPPHPTTFLFYSVKNPAEAYYQEALAALGHRLEHFVFVPHYSDHAGFLNLDYIRKTVGSLEDAQFLICGPPPLMHSLKQQLLEAGVLLKHIYTEDFGVL